jgi:DNA-damage-inducible protein J
MLLVRVAAEKKLPFLPKVPNAQTLAAMEEVEEMARSRRARFATAEELLNDIEKNSV